MAMKDGFSLIEVVVTILMIVLISTGMLAIFGQGFNYIKRTKDRSIAYNLVQEELERASSSYGSIAGYSKKSLNPEGFSSFYRELDVDVLSANLKRYNVTVWWDADRENLSVKTLKALF